MKLFLTLAFLLTGFSAQANWTHTSVINEVVGLYQSTEGTGHFVIRLRVGNNLEVAYDFGNGSGRLYMQCEASEDSVYNCVASDRNRHIQVMIGKLPAYAYALVSVDGVEAPNYYLKNPMYNLRY